VVNGYEYTKDTSKGGKDFCWSFPSLRELNVDLEPDTKYMQFYIEQNVIPLEIADDIMFRTVYDNRLE